MTTTHDSHVVWHNHAISRPSREAFNGHLGAVVWFTGLSGSGKSTLAGALEQALHARGVHTYLLDGDNTRHGLCQDLSFSDQDRHENIRRVGEVSALMTDAGLMVLAAFISPHRSERQSVRDKLPEGRFIEVFVDTALDVCEARDPKGLYKKARAGDITQFTGIDAAYEAPEAPELRLEGHQPVDVLVTRLIDTLTTRGLIPR